MGLLPSRQSQSPFSSVSRLFAALNSTSVPENKILVTTYEGQVLSPCQVDLSHEEDDNRMKLLMAHTYQQGHRKIMIHATDTDVLVLAITAASSLPGCEVWLAFGHGIKFRYIAVHDIASQLGDLRSRGLLFLHTIYGCDNVSAMCGIGKKNAWEVRRLMPHLDPLFHRLSQAPK
ncbi:hypothetical protein E2C01_059983 [Portunus trituberculatus]|uniref:Uncharacterized protein n=1 Tax=Portunus trituberculatus TaxID=210409 RepID=A0A5B7H994_PORTR|nr:hypothetical protein [Portunus trituberculatus]